MIRFCLVFFPPSILQQSLMDSSREWIINIDADVETSGGKEYAATKVDYLHSSEV